jgi:hypothetical protein
MKITYLYLLVLLFFVSRKAQSQVTNLTVETYYISDDNDSTDTDGGSGVPGVYLAPGSKTYRVYIQLAPGSKLKKIFGDAGHTIKVISTDTVFDNIDRGTSYGKDIPNNKLGLNTVALDTWITLGRATKIHTGVLKTDDTNGSIVGGIHNDGGSQGIAGGLLVNNDLRGGIPLTTADGLIPDTAMLGIWVETGFKDSISNVDSTIFGEALRGSQFISNDAYLQQNDGVAAETGSNNVLVMQLTTKGDLQLELNVVVQEPGVPTPSDVEYVARFAPGEANSDTLKLSPYLIYPPVCGCRDTKYLEYSSTFACDNTDSCKTLIVFGCMDPMACNYDATANFNIQDLCCYPGNCSNRDIAVVCPAITNDRQAGSIFSIYPNPAQNVITLQIPHADKEESRYEIYNYFGKVVLQSNMGVVSGTVNQNIDITNLPVGLYLFRLYLGDKSESKMFLKN